MNQISSHQLDGDAKPSVTVIGAGGTIAAIADTRADFQTYRAGILKTGELVDALRPELDGIAQVEPLDFPGKHAHCRTLHDYHTMSGIVDDQLTQANAVVVLCGTRSLEELAYWLDLTVRNPKPVVVTGAVRPWNALGGDGPANLYNAIALAASRRTTGFGTVVLLNDRILPARDATKTNTLRLDAFQSREWGVLGAVDATNIRLRRAPGRVQLRGSPEWITPFDLSRIDADELPRTEIVYSYADAGSTAIDAFVRAGTAGIVMAGDPSDRQGEALRAAVSQGMVVVAANRNIAGSVYDTGVREIISAEDLLPQKARLLLTLGLALTDDIDQLRSWFRQYGGPEF